MDYSYGQDSLEFYVCGQRFSQAEESGGGVPLPGAPLPPDTLVRYFIAHITGPFKDLFPIWKKYYYPEASDEYVGSMATIIDDNGGNHAQFFGISRDEYWYIHSQFQAMYKLKTVMGR